MSDDPVVGGAGTPQVEVQSDPATLIAIRAELIRALCALGLTLMAEVPDRLVFQRSADAPMEQSPLDLVRLAAQLPDRASAPVPEAERIRCPQCNAVASSQEEKCQWCGAGLKLPKTL